ncbi:hypothetical protein AGOR_G00125780 [Albula goreensis]|uniref:FAM21/CAPZIP domain-containing protein n=1 Tax=Albula goreensis TaxID=1534307 RepID=A0A8T3D7W4_9TELE|nr:hypothetical protein AGOR_G00125780 [Albula goreensis]
MEKKPVRRRPPRTLQLTKKTEEQTDEEIPANASPNAPKVRPRSSPVIEKLQANLALTPTALIPSPKSPEVKLQPTPFSPSPTLPPISPLTPPSPSVNTLSPTLSPALVSEEETPISFEDPPEGTVLPSINKSRARLSFKRRPPTRQHRKSCGEEVETAGEGSYQCQQDSQQRVKGEGETPEKANRKQRRVRVRKSSNRNGEKGENTERDAGAVLEMLNKAQLGANEDGEEMVAIGGDAKSQKEDPAEPEGEKLQGEICAENRIRASGKEDEETQSPQQEGEERGIGTDEDNRKSAGE